MFQSASYPDLTRPKALPFQHNFPLRLEVQDLLCRHLLDSLAYFDHGLAKPLAQAGVVGLSPEGAILQGVTARLQTPHIHLLYHILL